MSTVCVEANVIRNQLLMKILISFYFYDGIKRDMITVDHKETYEKKRDILQVFGKNQNFFRVKIYTFRRVDARVL